MAHIAYNENVPRNRKSYNAYQASYQLARYHRWRNTAIEVLDGACVHCGSTENLEIDHKDRAQKSFSIGKLWSVSQEKFDAELAKCQLLCEKCHRAKTSSEVGVDHGAGTQGKRGCTCVKCKAKRKEYSQSYRQASLTQLARVADL
jgi:hypothetical protein